MRGRGKGRARRRWNKEEDLLCVEQRAVIKSPSLYHFVPPSLTLTHSSSTKDTRPFTMFFDADVEKEMTV